MSLVLLACVPICMLCLIGWWIGRFYRMKFGDDPHSWLFLPGGIVGSAGLMMHRCAGLWATVGEVALLLSGIAIGGGALWLWYLLLGPRTR